MGAVGRSVCVFGLQTLTWLCFLSFEPCKTQRTARARYMYVRAAAASTTRMMKGEAVLAGRPLASPVTWHAAIIGVFPDDSQ